jgi:hypothetical protein
MLVLKSNSFCSSIFLSPSKSSSIVLKPKTARPICPFHNKHPMTKQDSHTTTASNTINPFTLKPQTSTIDSDFLTLSLLSVPVKKSRIYPVLHIFLNPFCVSLFFPLFFFPFSPTSRIVFPEYYRIQPNNSMKPLCCYTVLII